ncbi:hypothetical protein CKO43_04920 [Rubrivivax gelatinosus]|uniref:Uncharacterized protein n=2 Tax=Rubrivivax gelatinosus TaxID=28068 RepID=A0ABS1DQ39_RUBGE|nr:hypothetical protein [Rubrivivax gelatinosus]
MPYVPPTEGAVAQLRSGVYVAGGESAAVWIQLDSDPSKTWYPVFDHQGRVVKPDGYVNVRAGEWVLLNYNEALSAGRTCSIRVKLILEPGKRYSLVGGATFEPSVIPLLHTSRGCELRLKDDSDGGFMPMFAR